ncbi:MAG: ABC transporter ATP-binding protein/permease [Candidatus Thermoplasmatota archaeon]|nr:ABC transporter ATP-binding protein/permease [Candidatus Thermoplasmatota archaeon]
MLQKNNAYSIRRLFGVLGPLKFSLKFLRDKKIIVGLVIGFALATSALRLYIPIFIGDSVSDLQKGSYVTIEHIVLLIILVSALSAIFSFLVNYGSQFLTQNFSYKLRKLVFSKLIRKHMEFYQSRTSGDILSRMTMDVTVSGNFVQAAFSQLIPTVFLILYAFALLFMLKPLYAGLFVLVVPVLIFLGMVYQNNQRNHWRKIREHYGTMNEYLQENIIGNRVVRGFSREKNEIDRFSNKTDDYFEEYQEVARLRGLFNNLMPLVVSSASSIVLIYGGYTSYISFASVGSLVAAINIFGMISGPVGNLGRLIVISENANAGIERIDEITDSKLDEDHDSGIKTIENGDIKFHHVSFKRGNRFILKDLDFEVKEGEFLGITGKTASGKSTLFSLLSRFYDPTEGKISIGGVDLKDINLSTLRRFIAVVPQEVNIFSGTIRDNVAFGVKNVSDEEIERVCEISLVSEFVDNFLDRYNTLVGERGVTLSGGQKQRIAVARALLIHPHVLILDDATSSVDPETELDMLRNIRSYLNKTTVVVISLRYSVLKFCDRVLRLNGMDLIEDIEPSQLLDLGQTDGTGDIKEVDDNA